MKNKFANNYALIALYVFAVIALGALFIVLLLGWRDYFINRRYEPIVAVIKPFVYGFVIAYLLNPLMMLYERKVFGKLAFRGRASRKRGEAKLRRLASLAATFLTALIALSLVVWMVFPQISASARQLVTNVTDLFSPAEPEVDETEPDENGVRHGDANLIDESVSNYDSFMKTRIGVSISNVSASLQRVVSRFGLRVDVENSLRELAYGATTVATSYFIEYSETIINATAAFIFDTVRQVFNILLAVIVAFYMLADKERMIGQLKKLLNAAFPQRFVKTLAYVVFKTRQIFGGFIGAKVLESVIIFFICLAFMAAFRFNYAMLISVIIGITNVIPFFGPFIGAIPSIFFLLMADPAQAFWFALFIFILQQIDGSIIGPKIIGSRIGISSFWVIFAIMTMTAIMGPLGMFIGVPTFTVFYTLVKELANARLVKKGMGEEAAVMPSPAAAEGADDIAGSSASHSDAGQEAALNARIAAVLHNLSGSIRAQTERKKKNEDT
ncbi:MAG: AI-2E family transporter [Defluviitaleaceae bacterium]|nr:AI-2E family transporter [Defluviitaleaceae bacterium]